MNVNFKQLKIVGLMSGTSVDGINASLCITNGLSLKRTNYNKIYNYSANTKKLILQTIENPNLALKDKNFTTMLSNKITIDHANVVKKFLTTFNYIPELIGFHGQTIFHNPKKKNSVQLGNAQLLFELLKIPVISNFRDNDIINGGQGAPIAPIYHKYIIETLNLPLPTCFINIGGVSNLTYWDGKKLIGFDIGPGNAFVDKYMQETFSEKFDLDGNTAFKGNPNRQFINKFLLDPFFKLPYPKSLDKNYFSKFYKLLLSKTIKPFDIVSTLSQMTVDSIIHSILSLPKFPKNIILMGGGMNNYYFLNKLNVCLKNKVKTATKLNLPGDFIEAELISFLAARKFYNLPITFPDTTGVKLPMIGGQIFK